MYFLYAVCRCTSSGAVCRCTSSGAVCRCTFSMQSVGVRPLVQRNLVTVSRCRCAYILDPRFSPFPCPPRHPKPNGVAGRVSRCTHLGAFRTREPLRYLTTFVQTPPAPVPFPRACARGVALLSHSSRSTNGTSACRSALGARRVIRQFVQYGAMPY